MASRTRARINNLNDRAREVGAAGVLTLEDIDALKVFYDFTCLKCSKRPAISPDHVKPLAAGGENTVENLQLLCENCNKAKGDEEIDYRNGKVLTPDLVPLYSKTQDQTPTKQTYKRHDWDAIQHEYVTTKKTYAEIAQEFDVSESHLRQRGANEQWQEKREKFSTKLVQEIEQMTAKLQADNGFSSFLAGVDVLKKAIARWDLDGNKANLREIVEALKLVAAMQGETTSRAATVDETDLDDTDIIGAATSIARRAERKAAESDYSRGDTWQDGSGAGWTD